MPVIANNTKKEIEERKEKDKEKEKEKEKEKGKEKGKEKEKGKDREEMEEKEDEDDGAVTRYLLLQKCTILFCCTSLFELSLCKMIL
jgi:hypothetical protein